MPEQCLDDLEAAEKLLVLACRRTVPGRVAGPCVELAWRLRHPGGVRADLSCALPCGA
jgi:hypothetical protein